jgi:hypothetical protein
MHILTEIFYICRFNSPIIMKHTLPLLMLLAVSSISFAQNNNVWKATTLKTDAIFFENKKQIANPHLLTLDVASFKNTLANAPKRGAASRRSNTIITLPDADGQLIHFAILETSNMDPALSVRYPDIKSYIGQGVENPAALVYFSFSPLGLHSMMANPDRSAVFIEPYTTDLSVYTVYKKSDKAASLGKFECKVIAGAQAEIQNTVAVRPNADDGQLRNYRLALSVTGEYTAYFGGTKALALAAMNNTMTRVNGVFEIDFGVHMNLIANNDDLIYLNAATDPYSDAATGSQGSWNTELQNNLTTVLGNAAYDIGHLFGASGGGGNAGCIGCVCVNDTASLTDKKKGSGFTSPNDAIPSGDNFDIDYVAHEMGHQFGANHTWTHGGNEGSGVQVEPGSGSTIMGYAGITSLDVQPHSDAYFHAVSIQQVTNYIKTTTCQTTTVTGNAIPTASAGADYTVPKSTPFMLTGAGTDANGDTLTYDWEQMDSQSNATAPNATKTGGVNFRSYNPGISPIRYFPRMASVLAGATTTAGTELTVEALPSVARTLNFRLTVRDNRAGGPANNSDDAIITVNATAGPFTVNSPNTAVTYVGLSSQTITWSVAGTTANNVNCANVDILLSTDGGATFPITLLAATPNDGTQAVTIPNIPGINNRIMIKGTNHIFFDVSNTNFRITNSTPDTIAPTAPVLSAGGVTDVTTNLSWTGATDNIGVTDYDIFKDGVLAGNTSATTFTVTGLTALTTYSFTVKARDASSNSSVASNVVSVTTLFPVYCTSQGNSVADERIGNVHIGNINNTSVGGTGYTDFTAISTAMTIGSIQNISITPTWTGNPFNEGYAVFIDYNKDGDFLDSGETVWTKTASQTTPVTGSFTVPAGTTSGTTRMRVSMKFSGVPTACEAFGYGQVEDYTVVLTSASIVNLKVYVQGYYDVSSHAMTAVKANQGIGSSATDVADITVELRNPSTYALAATTTAVLQTNGTAVCTFNTAPSGSYYFVVKHRNAIQTWSAAPVTVGTAALNYDFSNAAAKAYQSNQVLMESGVWAIFTGDINQDDIVDPTDYSGWESDFNAFTFGNFATDLNGDGIVDPTDYSVWEQNFNGFVFAAYP